MLAADVTHRTEVIAVKPSSTMNAGATVRVWLLKKENMSANSLTSLESLLFSSVSKTNVHEEL